MSRSSSPSLLVCTLVLACGAAMNAPASEPAASASAAQPAAVAEADAEEGRICTREAVTGSTRKQRVCTTAAERAQARDKAQAEIHQAGRCAGNEVACRFRP